MFSRKLLSQARKELDVQLKQNGTITNKLTDQQRYVLLELFASWKNKSFKLLPNTNYGSRPMGSISDVEAKLEAAVEAAHQWSVNEKLVEDTVTCRMVYGNSLHVSGCIAMTDAALAVKYTKRFQKLEKAKKAKIAKKKAARDAAKQSTVLSKASAIKDLSKLLKELNQLKLLKSTAKVTKKAAKSKAKKSVKKIVSPFETTR